MAKHLTFLDKAFWITESNSSPKHVAGLQFLSFPEHNSPEENHSYVANLTEELRQFDKPQSPFSCVVVSVLGYPTRLVDVDKLDMNYHVQHHTIEDIDDKNEINAFIAKLHETCLERDKPLWQYHLIGSKNTNRYAIYTKIHHMYGDGVSLVRWFQAAMTEQPNCDNFTPVWAMEHPHRKRKKQNKWLGLLKNIGYFALTLIDLTRMFTRLLSKLLRINRHYMPLPFSGTKTVLTGQVVPGRTVATTDLPMDRVIALSKRTRTTINEILLTSFDIGVHRFLKDHGQTFNKALLTQMPINLRRPGEESSGNKIGIALVELAYGQKDPYKRLRQIVQSHKIVKRAAKRVYPAAFAYYTIWWQSWALVFEKLHLTNFLRPLGNILISNVPGPKKALYYKDSKVESIYPISALTPGGGVNITLLTYNGVANVGLVCCNEQIKSLEPMAQYFNEAFSLLEACVDDPSKNIDDIGEIGKPLPKSFVDDTWVALQDEKPHKLT
ncbi:MAG: diacylglycerol O-acyltransferase [Phenylobacterium sp.]|jgi:diacylglycerol O-acyltransferase